MYITGSNTWSVHRRNNIDILITTCMLKWAQTINNIAKSSMHFLDIEQVLQTPSFQ